MNEVFNCMSERRSTRHFLDKPIERELLEEIMWCGVQAPNGRNLQTWRFTVLENKARILHWKEQVCCTLQRTKSDTLHGFGNPAALVIVTGWKGDYNTMASCSCAIENILLAAWSLGIGGVWINALRTIQDEPDIRQMLSSYGIPENHLVVGTVALGYLPDGDTHRKPLRRKDVIQFVE